MHLTGHRVLVTGAGGFVGSHLCQLLLREGAHVRAFIRYQSTNGKGWLDRLPGTERNAIEYVAGDVRDFHAVDRAVKGMDAAFHLGALIAIPYSYLHPVDVVHTNVLGTLHIAQAARNHSLPLLIHTSTSETYGTAIRVPMDENHPLQGQSPYSASKIGADKIVESYHLSYGLPVMTIRPFNAYGPRQSMRAVIPTIIRQAMDGKEICLGNLAPTRDFTYVEDTARAFLSAAQAGLGGKGWGDTFNAGSGEEISIGDLARRICRIMGRDIPIRSDSQRVRPTGSEVERLFSDSRKAWITLGWKPARTLDEGLAATIQWMRRHPLDKTDEYIV